MYKAVEGGPDGHGVGIVGDDKLSISTVGNIDEGGVDMAEGTVEGRTTVGHSVGNGDGITDVILI